MYLLFVSTVFKIQNELLISPYCPCGQMLVSLVSVCSVSQSVEP